jgi:hypothetical protein
MLLKLIFIAHDKPSIKTGRLETEKWENIIKHPNIHLTLCRLVM